MDLLKGKSMKKMIVEIESCNDCPLKHTRDDGYTSVWYCNIDGKYVHFDVRNNKINMITKFLFILTSVIKIASLFKIFTS